MKPVHFAVDLNGTLVKYDKFRGERHFGEPVELAVKWVQKVLKQGHKVTVFTTRTNFAEVQDALVAMGFPRMPVTNIKNPDFDIFVDDRAIRFNGPGTFGDLSYVEDWANYQRPWWKE